MFFEARAADEATISNTEESLEIKNTLEINSFFDEIKEEADKSDKAAASQVSLEDSKVDEDGNNLADPWAESAAEEIVSETEEVAEEANNINEISDNFLAAEAELQPTNDNWVADNDVAPIESELEETAPGTVQIINDTLLIGRSPQLLADVLEYNYTKDNNIIVSFKNGYNYIDSIKKNMFVLSPPELAA